MTSKKSKSFEEAFNRMKQEEEAMAAGDLPLSEMMEHFRKGTEAARECLQMLHEIRKDVTVMNEEIDSWIEKEEEEDGSKSGEPVHTAD
jgi:exodeoxyribonuclease VII small subunit